MASGSPARHLGVTTGVKGFVRFWGIMDGSECPAWKRATKPKAKRGRPRKDQNVQTPNTAGESCRVQLANSPGPVTRRMLAMAQAGEGSSQVIQPSPTRAPEAKRLTPRKKLKM
uniref:Uncharacterized protein n=1 Tax=Oryza rufipogon TaxID=4529 RepID=A0A0E0MSR0_ORYRU